MLASLRRRLGLLNQPGAVAAAGSTIADAAVLPAIVNRVTGADGTKGVLLPDAAVGDEIQVVNDAGSTLKVYGPAGCAIGVPGTSFGAAVTDAAYLHTAFAVVRYRRVTTLLWSVTKSA